MNERGDKQSSSEPRSHGGRCYLYTSVMQVMKKATPTVKR